MDATNEAGTVLPGAQRHIASIVLLPVMNTVVIPGAILLSTESAGFAWLRSSPAALIASLTAALLLLIAGGTLVVASIAQFVRDGRGTLAPWDPPQRLVIRGPYRYCRNPMKAGLFCLLAAEVLLLGSAPLLYWFFAFTSVNLAYIRYFEEPGLRKRFGTSYTAYCRQVPRWIPRLGGRHGSANRSAVR